MLYMLDTDTVIFMLRGLKAPARQRARRNRAMALVGRCRAAQAKGDLVGLSSITVSELEFGAYNGDDYDAEIAAVHKLLAPFELLNYDAASCPPHYGRVRHELEQAGQPIGTMELLIAAHAIASKATLITNYVSPFRRVTGLNVVQWP